MLIKEEKGFRVGFTFEDVFREINIYTSGIKGAYSEFAVVPSDKIFSEVFGFTENIFWLQVRPGKKIEEYQLRDNNFTKRQWSLLGKLIAAVEEQYFHSK